jgi:hypothetical protein
MRTMEILSAVTGGGGEAGPAVLAVKLAPFVKTVAAEQQLLNSLQIILAKQVPYHSGKKLDQFCVFLISSLFPELFFFLIPYNRNRVLQRDVVYLG